MGLDMYLEKRTYVKNWSRMKPENQHQITVLKGGKPTKIKPERIREIVEEVAYWRKANAIHQWLVDHVQEGNDNCGQHYVREEDLRELLSICTKVLEASELIDGDVTNGYTFKDGKEVPIVEKGKVIKDPSTAKELLPTQDGFLFGGTDYDEWYRDDIEYTKKVLEQLFAEDPDGQYYYSSSW
jgi:hypothetical protein